MKAINIADNGGVCGRLYGVGVGPGDPELVTVKAVRILQQVPVICVPQAERSRESYALAVVKGFLDLSKQELLFISFPTNDSEKTDIIWKEAADKIAWHLHQGRDVAFITEGDPLLYSTFSYILGRMRTAYPSISVEIIPGVSSVTAAAAKAGVPLASHGQRMAILPAMYGVDNLQETLASFDTVVLMKVNRKLLETLRDFKARGLLLRKTVYVKRATTPHEQIVHDIGQLSQQDMDYFSLLIITR